METEKDKNDIFRDEQIFEENLLVLGKQEKKAYEFSLVSPGSETPQLDSKVKAIANTVSAGAKTLQAYGTFSSNNRRLEWVLEARADMTGVDYIR